MQYNASTCRAIVRRSCVQQPHQGQQENRMKWSSDNSYSSSFLISFLILLSSCSIALCSLEEPTLIGVKECTELPDNVRFPLYWTSKYSLDRKTHHGPKDLFTIIGNATTATNSTGNYRLLLLTKKQNHPVFGQDASDGTIRASRIFIT